MAVVGLVAAVLTALGAAPALAGGKPEHKPTAHVKVVKKVVPPGTTGEDVTGAMPAAGWTFTGTSATAGVGGVPATETTGADGAVAFDLTFPKDARNVGLTVAETQQGGFELVTQGGFNATCVDDRHHVVPVVNDDSMPGRPAFLLHLAKDEKVKCVVYNRPVKAEVTVAKQWVIDGQTFAQGSQPAGFDAVLTLTGPGDAGATPQPSGVPRAGYLEGETATLDETVTIPASCTLDAGRVTLANGVAVDAALPFRTVLAKGSNTFTVTNRVTCPSPPTPPPTPPTPPTPPPAVTPPAPPSQGEVLGVRREGRPRLRIEKRASARSVMAGETVRFTLVVRNVGNVAARQLRVCDRLPRDVTVVDRGGGRLVAGGRVCWRIRRLAAHSSTRRALVVRVDSDARPGTIVNRATVRGAGQRRSAQRRVRVVRRPAALQPRVGGVQVTG